MKVIIQGKGVQDADFWTLPEGFEVTVTRFDGRQPSKPEIFTALKIAVEALTPTRKTRKTKLKTSSTDHAADQSS